jgi:hypothetical protein
MFGYHKVCAVAGSSRAIRSCGHDDWEYACIVNALRSGRVCEELFSKIYGLFAHDSMWVLRTMV